jgi:hypothetical protein
MHTIPAKFMCFIWAVNLLLSVGVQVNCPPFPVRLSFRVELVGACKLQLNMVSGPQVSSSNLAGNKIITDHSSCYGFSIWQEVQALE